jgi:hypothetical protein
MWEEKELSQQNEMTRAMKFDFNDRFKKQKKKRERERGDFDSR